MDIYDGDIETLRSQVGLGLCQRGRMSDDRIIPIGSQGSCDSFTDDRMVINNEKSQGSPYCHRMLKPPSHSSISAPSPINLSRRPTLPRGGLLEAFFDE